MNDADGIYSEVSKMLETLIAVRVSPASHDGDQALETVQESFTVVRARQGRSTLIVHGLVIIKQRSLGIRPPAETSGLINPILESNNQISATRVQR